MSSDLFIEIRFPGGRYHATPWGRQVNEGAVEWPPSPWRFLRALISVWHATAQQEISETTLQKLVQQLSEVVPDWQLPQATQAHTRHYMPTRTSSSKIFDTFLIFKRDAVAIARWPAVELDQELQQALDLLLSHVNYLGRSESWVELRRIDSPAGFYPNAGPASHFNSSEGRTSLQLLAPLPTSRFEDWRVGYRDAMQSRRLDEKRRQAEQKNKDPQRVKLTKKDLENIDAALPNSPYQVLIAETDRLQKAGWSQPPGSFWIDYLVPRLTSWLPPRIDSPARADLPTFARFAVASNVPPRLTTAIYQAQKLHQSLVKYSDNHPLFTGVDINGKPLKGHQHAFIFAEANDGQTDRITHLNVWVPGGIDDIQRTALDRVRRLWGKDGHDLQLVLIGVGHPEDFAGFNTQAGQSPLTAQSTHWRSLTPFINPRHPKRRKNGEPKRDQQGLIIDGAEHTLRRFLRLADLPEIVAIKPLDHLHIGGRNLRWLEFNTHRKSRNNHSGARGKSTGHGFEIEFAEPLRGPLAFGYGAHYGLGLFTPINPSEKRK